MSILTQERQKKIFKFMPILAVFITTVAFIIGALVIKINKSMKITIDPPRVLNEGWSYSDTKENVEGTILPFYENKETVICRSFTEEVKEGTYLVLWNFYSKIKVFVDGNEIYNEGSIDEEKFGTEEGGLWYFIPIPEGKHNDIKISLTSTWRNQNFYLDTIYYGSKNDIASTILKKNNVCIIISLILLIYVILLLMYLATMNYYKLKDYSRLVLSLCGLTFVSIFYILNESNLFQFVLKNPSIRYLGSYFSVYMIPVFGYIFFREFYKNGKQYHVYSHNIYCSLLVISIVLYMCNVLHLVYSVVIVYVAVSEITLLVVRFGLQDYNETKDPLCIWGIVAVTILILGTIVSVSFYYLGITTSNIIPFSFTYLMFISILFITVMRRTFTTFSMATSAEYYQVLAYTDKITGGNSRTYFEEKIKNKTVENSYFILINLVQFKLINQIAGRKNSDDLLKGIYSEINLLLKSNDLLCSLGNARFGVWLNVDSEKELVEFCENVKIRILKYTNDNLYTIKVSEQFSVCQIEKDNRNLDYLIDCALMAVGNKYAKYIPEIDCFIYNKECNNQLIKEKMLADYLDTALENEEFKVYLQPKISLKDGRVHAAEALVRWFNPERGIIPPDEFIPSFEADGKIELVDLYTFKKVCEQIKEWLANGFVPPIISVNISKVAITFEGYFNRYMEIIDEVGISGKYLEFELTESIAYNNIEMLREIIQKIHAIGSTCSMDDFGKSYSNISVLGILPFDIAKMDKCFFDDGFPTAEKSVQLVKGTVGLLKNLNLEIVAEGIEEKAQVDALASIGCDCVQGYYFAKPMNLEDFVIFVKNKNNM